VHWTSSPVEKSFRRVDPALAPLHRLAGGPELQAASPQFLLSRCVHADRYRCRAGSGLFRSPNTATESFTRGTAVRPSRRQVLAGACPARKLRGEGPRQDSGQNQGSQRFDEVPAATVGDVHAGRTSGHDNPRRAGGQAGRRSRHLCNCGSGRSLARRPHPDPAHHPPRRRRPAAAAVRELDPALRGGGYAAKRQQGSKNCHRM
jgi:hypothetical protein